jgi:regulator of protease activity HflC (stomatin/prohibitin superfamily)
MDRITQGPPDVQAAVRLRMTAITIGYLADAALELADAAIARAEAAEAQAQRLAEDMSRQSNVLATAETRPCAHPVKRKRAKALSKESGT